MEVGGYKPVESIPTPAKAAEVAAAAATVRGVVENVVGAEKTRFGNGQLEQAALKKLEGINDVSPGVGVAARSAIEVVARATDLGATVEGWQSGLTGGMAGAAEWVAKSVFDLKLDQWGRRVDKQTQYHEANELNLTALGAVRSTKVEAVKENLRRLVPEAAVGFFDKLAGGLRKKEGQHARRKDEMRERANVLRQMETKKAEPSDDLKGELTDLRDKYTTQAEDVRKLQEYVRDLEAKMNANAQVVGGTRLENITSNRPLS